MQIYKYVLNSGILAKKNIPIFCNYSLNSTPYFSQLKETHVLILITLMYRRVNNHLNWNMKLRISIRNWI